jgi:hypothetical protein
VEIRVKKTGLRGFSQKENADFLINVLGLSPIDQRFFFLGDQRKKRELSRVYNQIRVKKRLLFG